MYDSIYSMCSTSPIPVFKDTMKLMYLATSKRLNVIKRHFLLHNLKYGTPLFKVIPNNTFFDGEDATLLRKGIRNWNILG